MDRATPTSKARPSAPRGWHAYVAPTGRGNTVNLGGLGGIDWHGRGGYVVAPPSVKCDGSSWSWITGTAMDLGPDTPIVPAPAWVLNLLDVDQIRGSTPGAPGPTRHAGLTGYGAAALEREVGRLLMAPEGTRNHQLNRWAHALGQLVGGGVLTVDEVGDSLLVAAVRTGLSEAEAEATIKSGLAAGLRSPRAPKKIP